MFTVPLERIVTPSNLLDAANTLRSKAAGLDGKTLKDFRNNPKRLETLSQEILTGRYTPEPLRRIHLEKADGQTRPIAVGAAKDRIVQKCLAMALTPYFDPTFSPYSFGYRPDIGVLQAIRHVKTHLQEGYRLVFKSDIENFFETIPHDRLLARLEREIADNRLVGLIALFLQNGTFDGFDYTHHPEGVHQGDPLSPLLANIYLDGMDRWLEKEGIVFARFADDFVLLFKTQKARKKGIEALKAFLSTLGLGLNSTKSYTADTDEEGFDFLGYRFYQNLILIENERLQKQVSRLYKLAKKAWPIARYVDETAVLIEGLEHYYLQIIDPQSPQFSHLQRALHDSATRRFAKAFAQKELRTKKEALPLALRLPSLGISVSSAERRAFAKAIVDAAKTMATDTAKTAKSALGRKKQHYARQMALSTTLIVEKYGAVLGIAKKRIVLKEKRKIVHSLPVKRCERILIQTPGASLSSALVRRCVDEGIAIDFIDKDATPYAALVSYKQSVAPRTLRQLALYDRLAYRQKQAAAFVRAKLKNQRNYLKYLNKHHRQLQSQIDAIAAITARIPKANSIETLFGLEGSASALYWEALALVLEDKISFPGRITQGATDPFNSALNYGYAILYGEIRRALLQAGLALHISFLHAVEESRPSLVFDFIEPFRAFAVDRTVVTMFNRQEPVHTDKTGLLTQSSRKLVAQNVLERLGSYTKHDGATKRLGHIIQDEAQAFARAIDRANIYRPFIGRY